MYPTLFRSSIPVDERTCVLLWMFWLLSRTTVSITPGVSSVIDVTVVRWGGEGGGGMGGGICIFENASLVVMFHSLVFCEERHGGGNTDHAVNSSAVNVHALFFHFLRSIIFSVHAVPPFCFLFTLLE